MVGDVDAGKSTILGRLLVDLDLVTPTKLEELETSSSKRGVPIEYSFLLDAFQLERDQAITLDLTRIWVRTAEAEFVFVDAPGHRELIRNLLSGASEVDAAVMVVAADEGITLQTRRQALFLRWFGFANVLVAINKLDLATMRKRLTKARRRSACVSRATRYAAARNRTNRCAQRRRHRQTGPTDDVVEWPDAARGARNAGAHGGAAGRSAALRRARRLSPREQTLDRGPG